MTTLARWAVATALLALTAGALYAQDPAAAGTADLWVAPDGQDTNPGTEAQPLASLRGARDAVRALRRARPEQDILVLFQGGTYPLESPVEFSAADSGRAGGRVTYAACPGARPLFSGARAIRGFEPGADGIWQVRVPGVQEGTWRFEQLFVNGRRAVRARTPNQFYSYMDGTVASGIDPLTGEKAALSDHAFLARAADVAPLLALAPDQQTEVVVSAYHSWEISRHHVVAVEPTKNLVYLSGRYPPTFFHYAAAERYILENYRAALDVPGEWFLDRDGMLYYKPLPGEDLRTAEVAAPVPEALLRFSGDADAPVANLAFRGLAFAYSAYLMPPAGQWSPQAACNIGAAITADYAHNLIFSEVAVEHTGTYAFWFRAGCRDSTVERCLLTDLGAGGVRLGQTDALPQPDACTRQITVDNTIIRGAGRVWPDAVGILIGHSGDNRITHNDISFLPYTAISVGWTWGYGVVPSQRNTISYNHIHHLGWDVLADMGGIYTLGEAPGTVLSHNLIHDLDGSGDSGMHGLYNDNSTSFMLLENNLVYNVRDGAYQIGSGKGNILRNNIFIARPQGVSTHGQLLFCMYNPAETHVAATFERNLIYGSGGKLFSVPDFGSRLEFRQNLYWEPSGKPLDFAGTTFAEWQAQGRDVGSVIADPQFVNPAANDFRLRPDSPALALTFVPFDPAEAGVYGTAAWLAEARNFTPPAPWSGVPPPPPATFADDFEDTPGGDLPARTSSLVEGKGDSIAVTAETAAGGKHSLKVTDAPGLEHSFNPHFWYAPAHYTGVSVFSLDLRLEAGAELNLEWREYPGVPYYYKGPSLFCRDATLLVADRALMALPVGTWFHLEIRAGQGAAADGTWQLAVTLPGAAPQRFTGLPTGSPEVRSTTWIGFISSGERASTYYLDNVRLDSAAAAP
jgi:hypothetical protein